MVISLCVVVDVVVGAILHDIDDLVHVERPPLGVAVDADIEAGRYGRPQIAVTVPVQVPGPVVGSA